MTATKVRTMDERNGILVPDWLKARRDVSNGAKSLYAQLCRYAGKKDTACPQQETLAVDLGVTVRTICRGIRELVKVGLIHVERSGRASTYRFPSHPWMSDATLGAGDISVGQQWHKSLTQVSDRGAWTVIRVTDARVYLETRRGDQRFTCDTDFGSLLSDWVLVAEAGE